MRFLKWLFPGLFYKAEWDLPTRQLRFLRRAGGISYRRRETP